MEKRMASMNRGTEGKAGRASAKKAPRVESKSKAILIAKAALEYKALELVVLELGRHSSFADYFVICSGKSSRQVQGIADNLETRLKGLGLLPLGVEGRNEGHWVLMDYGDVIVHVFYEPVRALYDLESLWSEAVVIPIEDAEKEMTGA